MKIKANGIDIEVEDRSPADDPSGRPVVLLIMGLGMQLIGWPDDFVQGLIDAGFRVIRHDNRDMGLSQGFDDAERRNMVWQTLRSKLGLPVRSPYTLQDMADDAVGVLDALGVERAHVVGASMGGMIAQRVAAGAPSRVASLVSIMSSSGARGLPGPAPELAAALLKRPRSTAEADLVAFSVSFVRRIGSPAYQQPTEALQANFTRALRRAYRPAGLMRQLLAIGADTQRAELLARIACPTLVLHGEADRLVPIACGRDTARRIAGSSFVSIPGMGHDMPPEVCRLLNEQIVPFVRGVENATATARATATAMATATPPVKAASAMPSSSGPAAMQGNAASQHALPDATSLRSAP